MKMNRAIFAFAFVLALGFNAMAQEVPESLAWENDEASAELSNELSGEEDLGYELDAQGEQSMKHLEANGEKLSPLLDDQMEKEGLLDIWDVLYGGTQYDEFGFAKKKVGNKCVPTKGKILMGCCGMYVRLYLDSKGLIPDGYRLAPNARDFGPPLKKAGFCNVMKKYKARTAPVGAVLVYTGGPHGHVEIRTKGGYYFGPTNAAPATEWKKTRRTLTGIYVKCGK